MSTTRIKDISTTASAAATDDYIVLDGSTNGTRKILASDIGGGGTTLYIEVNGNQYEVTGFEKATVSGVTGMYLYYDDGNDGAIFFPDGVAMNTVKQAIEAEIPTAVSELTNDSGFLTNAVTSFNGQSGAVTYTAPVASVNGQAGAVVLDADDVGAEPAVSEYTIATDGAVTQALEAGKIYHFTGDLTSLTITLTATDALPIYHFDFLSGSTAPTLNLPSTVTMPDTFAVDANKRYEINILDTYGLSADWATGA